MINREFNITVDGLKIAGEVFLPDLNGIHPGLVICHGIPQSQYEPGDRKYAVLAERFCGEGFATAIFNFRGAGKSEGNLDIAGWARDLEGVLGYMKSRKGVYAGRIAVLGSSAGAAVAACVAARNPATSQAVLMACPADFDQLVDPARAKPFVDYLRKIGLIRDQAFPGSIEEWVSGFAVVRPESCIGKLAPRPVLIIHGDGDDTVPVAHAHRLYKAAGEPKELIILPGAGHRLRLEEAAVEAASGWLKRSLLN